MPLLQRLPNDRRDIPGDHLAEILNGAVGNHDPFGIVCPPRRSAEDHIRRRSLNLSLAYFSVWVDMFVIVTSAFRLL